MLVLRDWLKEYCGESIPHLSEIEKLFTFHAFEVEETSVVEGHEVIDVKILPDRASDCLSHRGIARELAAITNVPLVYDPFQIPPHPLPESSKLRVTISSDAHCDRFALAHISGVTIAPSPGWLVCRLRALGQRSINNVVDATNYVMLALGQPLHAYDARKFSAKDGVWHVGVRMAKEGESITTLTGETYDLNDSVQLITHQDTDTPAGIAGIKGGSFAEIDEMTTDLLIEAAHFNAQITRKASQFLRLQTDASKRFENNLSPEVVAYALSDVVKLILDIAGGTCEGHIDVRSTVLKNKAVTVQLEHIHALLGIQITAHEVENIFTRLGFTYTHTDHSWEVRAPFERTDIAITEDVIAEVGRIYGYVQVPSIAPIATPFTEYNSRFYYAEKIRAFLIERGFSEVITSSFCKKDIITLRNAFASDKKCLRSTLGTNLREVMDRNMPNADLLAIDDIRVFEIGTVFQKASDGSDVVENISLALGVRTKQQGYVQKDDVFVTEIMNELISFLGKPLDIQVEKGVCECNLTAYIETLPAPTAYEAIEPPKDILFQPYSAFPFVTRDIAVWVPEEINVIEVENILKKEGGELLLRVTLFDEFKKENKISYAFRLVFQSYEKTLTDQEVNERMSAIVKSLSEASCEVR